MQELHAIFYDSSTKKTQVIIVFIKIVTNRSAVRSTVRGWWSAFCKAALSVGLDSWKSSALRHPTSEEEPWRGTLLIKCLFSVDTVIFTYLFRRGYPGSAPLSTYTHGYTHTTVHVLVDTSCLLVRLRTLCGTYSTDDNLVVKNSRLRFRENEAFPAKHTWWNKTCISRISRRAEVNWRMHEIQHATSTVVRVYPWVYVQRGWNLGWNFLGWVVFVQLRVNEIN